MKQKLLLALKLRLPLQQRKSRRLVAKAEKQAEARQFEDDYVFGGENQLGAACLLQGSSVKDLSLLISQVRFGFSHRLPHITTMSCLRPSKCLCCLWL